MANVITTLLKLDSNQFKTGMKSVQQQVKETDGFVAKAKVGITGMFSSFASSPTAIAGATAAIGTFAVASVNAASDLNESINAVNVTFGKSADKILEFGDNAAKSVGLAKSEFNELATPLGSILKNAGFQLDDVADKTIILTQRAADMASVFNTDVSDALGAIQAGLRGEQDPLEKYGVGLSAAKVEARALADTGKDTAKALTDQEKQLARVEIILDQTNQTAGDFANTSDGLANETRILKAEFQNLQAAAGQELIPVLEDLAGSLITLEQQAKDAGKAIHDIPGVPEFVEFVAKNLNPVGQQILLWRKLGDAVEAARDQWSSAGDDVRDLGDKAANAGPKLDIAAAGVEAVGTAAANTTEAVSHTADIWFAYLNAQGAATGSFAEMSSAADKAILGLEGVGDQAKDTADDFNPLLAAINAVADAVDTAFEDVRDNLDLQDLVDDITDQFGKIAEAAKDTTDPEGIRNYNRAVRDLQRQLLTLLDSINGIPPDKKVRIAAEIQRGSVDDLYRILGDLEKGVTVPVSFATAKTDAFSSVQGLFAPGQAPSAPIFNNPTPTPVSAAGGYIDNSTTIINNPIGSTPTTQYIDGQTDFRRNGLR